MMSMLYVNSYFLILRFVSHHFERGLGFKLDYESTNVAPQVNYRMGESGKCGGMFTTLPFGIITSPSYPNKYPVNADCVYTISRPSGTVIHINFLDMDIHCRYDYIEIKDGLSKDSRRLTKLCGNLAPSNIVKSTQNHMWIK